MPSVPKCVQCSLGENQFMPMTNGCTQVTNPAEALVNQEGTFEVVSPAGRIFEVTCRRGHGMTFRQVREPEGKPHSTQETWLIRQLPSQSV